RQLFAVGKARRQGRRLAEGDQLFARLGPVDHQQADVGERVAEGAELPVDDRGHLALRGEDHVVEAVVAVDYRRRSLLWDPGGEPLVDLVDERQLPRLRLLPLAVPAMQLAG